ncbi:MAG: efflux RND transporter periplasmic adaptor subunit [Vicinamibacterales bacterium]
MHLHRSFVAFSAALVLISPAVARGQAVETAPVTRRADQRVVQLPGELTPFQASALSARIGGFVEHVQVDRGSVVKQGQVLATLAVPELTAQSAEARSRVLLAEARRAEAESKVTTVVSTLERLKRAASTPGTVAGLDLLRAEEDVASARAAFQTQVQAIEGAKAALQSVLALEEYRSIVAPFAGRITERLVHPGALVGPTTGPLFRLEQVSRLRLVLPVPEHSLGVIAMGRILEFRVPAHPGRTFSAKLARSAGSLDSRTRTMSIEADVDNAAGLLAPGMFPEVSWTIARETAGMLVPATAVVTTTERTFVIRVTNGKAEWVTVKKGAAAGDQVEVAGDLKPGDLVVKRATDEIRNGSVLKS